MMLFWRPDYTRRVTYENTAADPNKALKQRLGSKSLDYRGLMTRFLSTVLWYTFLLKIFIADVHLQCHGYQKSRADFLLVASLTVDRPYHVWNSSGVAKASLMVVLLPMLRPIRFQVNMCQCSFLNKVVYYQAGFLLCSHCCRGWFNTSIYIFLRVTSKDTSLISIRNLLSVNRTPSLLYPLCPEEQMTQYCALIPFWTTNSTVRTPPWSSHPGFYWGHFCIILYCN